MAEFGAIARLGHSLDLRFLFREEETMTLIALNADVLVTMDAQRREIKGGALVAD